jgi:hypothetical protein
MSWLIHALPRILPLAYYRYRDAEREREISSIVDGLTLDGDFPGSFLRTKIQVQKSKMIADEPNADGYRYDYHTAHHNRQSPPPPTISVNHRRTPQQKTA